MGRARAGLFLLSDLNSILGSRLGRREGFMAVLDLSKLVKEKRFWFASAIVAGPAALQGHMMWLLRQDAFNFKNKFGGGLDHQDDPPAPATG